MRFALPFIFCSLALAQSKTYEFPNLTHPQQIQDAATTFRTVLGIKDLTADVNAKSISVNATPDQIAMADWLSPLIGKAPGAIPADTQSQVYAVGDGGDDEIEFCSLAHLTNPQAVQEILTELREIGRIAKVYGFFEPPIIAFRANTATVAAGDWLVRQLDVPAAAVAPGNRDFSLQDGSGDVARLDFTAIRIPNEGMAQLLAALRSTAKVRAFGIYSPQVVSMRGTPEQIAQAQQIVEQRTAQ